MALDCIVVGCGAVGSQFDRCSPQQAARSHAGACRLHDETRLVAGVDTSSDRREQFESQWDTPAFETLAAAAESHDPDVVCVSTPTETHELVVEASLETGPSAIFCEKPVAQDLETAEQIVETCTTADVNLLINYHRRYTPSCRTVRDLYEQGELGDVTRAVFTYSKGFLENGSHMVDLARFWFGPVTSATAYETGPAPTGRLVCGGVPCLFVSTETDDYSHTRADVYGTEQFVRLESNGEQQTVDTVEESNVYPGFDVPVEAERKRTGIHRAFYHAFDNIVGVVTRDDQPTSPGTEGLETLRACHRLLDTDDP